MARPLPRALEQDGVHLVPEILADDGLVLAGKALPLVHRHAPVHLVVQQLVHLPLVDRLAPLVPHALPGQFSYELGC
jgi:hypothetical protein